MSVTYVDVRGRMLCRTEDQAHVEIGMRLKPSGAEGLVEVVSLRPDPSRPDSWFAVTIDTAADARPAGGSHDCVSCGASQLAAEVGLGWSVTRRACVACLLQVPHRA